MGQSDSKKNTKQSPAQQKKYKLDSNDIKFLRTQTGMLEFEIQKIYNDFMENNPDAQLNQAEFIALYSKLRSEPNNKLEDISKLVFNAFDKVGFTFLAILLINFR
jgi:4-hydroxy-3-methylbut-2-enyl diphosphate reductase IspH